MPVPDSATDPQWRRRQIRSPALASAVLFMAASLAMTVLALMPMAGDGTRDGAHPLWWRWARFVVRTAQTMTRPGAETAERLLLPAVAAWGAWAACRRLLPDRFLECAIGGLAYGFAPSLLSMLAHGVAREAFGHALLPFMLLALLRHGESGRPVWGWIAIGWLAILTVSVRAGPPVAVVGIAAWFHGHRLALEAGRPPWSWAWMAPTAVALLVFLADPLGGGWLLEAYPSVVGLRDSLTLPQRAASLIVLRSSLGPGGLAWTAPTAYLGKVVALLVILALAVPGPAWRPWKIGWVVALGGFLVFYLLPDWWLGLFLPAASTVVRISPWSLLSAVMLLSAVLASLGVARIFDALTERHGPRLVLVLVLGWWMLVDAAQSVPRGWSELRGTIVREEADMKPTPDMPGQTR